MEERCLNLLAVDDDPGDLEILRRTVEEIPDWDIDFHSVTDPQEVTPGLAIFDPALILLDQQLGSTTGLELCRKVRREGFDRPVIMLTGQGNERLAVEALRAGVSDYLPKNGLDGKRLRSSIEGALERERLEREIDAYRLSLEEINARLGRRTAEIESFYHVLSHELKTPLTVIREFVGIVLDRIPGPLNAEQDEYLGIARENCDRMVRQIDDLVDSARLETGKLAVRLRPTDLVPLIKRVITALRPEVVQAGLDLVSDLPAALPGVLLDRDRVAQIVTNLVHNAVKFTPAGGRIGVGAECLAGVPKRVRVRVSDTGVGIEATERERIFERLYQVKTVRPAGTESRPEGLASDSGLGLGLSICRQLVLLHGGALDVESRPGQGSTFFFTLCQEKRPRQGPLTKVIES